MSFLYLQILNHRHKFSGIIQNDREFGIVDICKFIMAFAVIAIHTNPVVNCTNLFVARCVFIIEDWTLDIKMEKLYNMENRILVSVIVLSYRSSDTIIQTLESIKKQTYQDIELIVTDDCSPDNTVEVVKKWIAKNKMRFVNARCLTATKNTGLPANFNRGLYTAKGKYFKGIAGDDYMSEDAIEKYVAFCEKNPQKYPICKVHLFKDSVNQEIPLNIKHYCDRCYDFAQKTYKEQYHALLMQNCILAPAATFYKVEEIKKLGGYDEKYPWFEDYPMNLKIMHAGKGFGLIAEELVWYRLSDKSVTASQQVRLKKSELKLFANKKIWYMIQAGMGIEALKQCKSWSKVLFMK